MMLVTQKSNISGGMEIQVQNVLRDSSMPSTKPNKFEQRDNWCHETFMTELLFSIINETN